MYDGVVEVGAEVAGGVQGPGQSQVVISLGHLPDNTHVHILVIMATQGQTYFRNISQVITCSLWKSGLFLKLVIVLLMRVFMT